LKLFLVSFLSGIITFILLSKIIPILSINFLDKPNERSSHSKPVPSGGGIAFVLVICITSTLFRFWIPLYCLPLAVIGFVDDFIGLPAIYRYVSQLLTVGFIFTKTNLFYYFSNLFSNFECFIIFIIFLFIGTAIINFINFMDGLDGFLVSNFIIILISSALIVENSILLMIGPLMGFIFYNWQPAKVFMGDVGSTFLGAVFFGILVKTNSINDSFLVFLIGFPLLVDAFICVIRRFSMGHNIFLPHKLHLYQRLNQAGISHSKISTLYSIFTLTIALTALFNKNYVYLPVLFCFMIALYFDKNIATSFK